MITIGHFLEILFQSPFLVVVMVLILGSIFVNGSTDAANAIAEPVAP